MTSCDVLENNESIVFTDYDGGELNMLGGARHEMAIVTGALHWEEIGSGGVDRVLVAVDGVQLWAFVKTAQSKGAS